MPSTTPNSKAKNIGFWIISILGALPFIGAGLSKLSSQPMMVAEFTHWGFPLWFMTFTGITEIVGAILLIVPKSRVYGGILLFVTMFVALIVHIVNGEISAAIAPIILAILPVTAGYFQFKRNGQKLS